MKSVPRHGSPSHPLPAQARVSVTVPAVCMYDQWVHENDLFRCLDLVARERPEVLVVTLACGCPLIAMPWPLERVS